MLIQCFLCAWQQCYILVISLVSSSFSQKMWPLPCHFHILPALLSWHAHTLNQKMGLSLISWAWWIGCDNLYSEHMQLHKTWEMDPVTDKPSQNIYSRCQSVEITFFSVSVITRLKTVTRGIKCWPGKNFGSSLKTEIQHVTQLSKVHISLSL